jgi:hypothetical protein
MKSKLFKVLGVVAIVAMLATALVAPAAAVSAVSLSVTSGTAYINAAGNYTVFGTLSTALAGGTTLDTITITFPAGYVLSATPTATINAGPGWVGSPATYQNSITTGTVFTVVGQTVVATLNGTDQIGAGAQVLINITAGVTNPSIAGSYTVTLQTSQETTAVTSNAVTINNPVITPLPGVVTVFNTAGILVSQSNSLATGIGVIAGYPGGVIKLTAGTYFDSASSNVSFTIQGMDANAANVIIKAAAPWTLNGATVVIDKVTIDGSNSPAGPLTLSATTAGTISNSILQGGVVTLGGVANTLSADTVTVLTGATGVSVGAVTTITNCTFSVAGTGIGIANGAANVTVSGCTFTGAASTGLTTTGTGVVLTGGTGSVVGTSKFTGLTEALDITGAAVSFTGNTVDKCGATTTATTGPDAIMVHTTVAPGVQVGGNTITNSLDYIINVAANQDNLVWVMGNTFSGNVHAAYDAGNFAVGIPLAVTHNYWGGTASNPASVTTAPLISYANPLGSASSMGSISAGPVTATTGTFDTSASAGVIITSPSVTTELGAIVLGANPITVAIPTGEVAKSYYDVFGVGATVTASLQFNGSTAKPIAATDVIYMWDSVNGTWNVVSNGGNAYSNFILTNVPVSIAGTYFCVATTLPTVPPVTPDVTPQYPESGATNVPVDVTFTWQAVTDATGYQFAIAQDNPDLANKFAVLDYSANTITNAHKVQETLLYNTTYWWEVRSVAGTVVSPWTIVTFFTTEAAPVATSTTTAPPITVTNTTVTYTNPPATTITYTLPQPKETQPIPSYLLWAVIAVGAVLVIAVIVLIVRTRRMP